MTWRPGASAMALALAGTTCLAMELPDCQLEQSPLASTTGQSLRRSSDAKQLLIVSARNLRNGADISYGQDEPVLVADLKVLFAVPALVAISDISVKSSWPLSPGFKFVAGRPLIAAKQLKLSDDRIFTVLELKGGSTLFVNDSGQICDKALNSSSAPNVWMAGTLSQEGSSGRFERQIVEQDGGTGSLRIIFNGLSAGVMSFQEVWVNGPTLIKSMKRNFDQFAKAISLGPFTFEVIEAAGGRVTLRYEIADRSPIDVGADPNLSHRADRILSQGWKPTLRWSAVDKFRSWSVSLASLVLC